MYESLPDTQHGPDHQLGVQSVQAEGHPGCRDAVGSVQHVSGQRAGLRHDLLDGRGQVRFKCGTFNYSNRRHDTIVWKNVQSVRPF